MQRIITLFVVVAVVLIAGLLYFTRPVSAPTQAVDTVAEKLVPVTKIDESSIPVVEQKVYRISQEQSSVQFSIDEILNGAPFTAVGKTSEVAGDIAVTRNQITVGAMAVNAKTFKTDSSRRDGAIVRFILKSDQPANEFITFKPTAPIAFTAPIVEGKEISTKISGDLTVSGVTKPATFAVKIKTQAGKLLVTGGTTVKRSDFDLKIPELSFVASVDDKVMISVSAVAEMVK
jgi:polyisoprenoid-binding protein YceI